MASNYDMSYVCEICGLENLTEETMRIHTKECHLDENGGVCPFCDLTGVSSDELTIHVNQVHLDYLSPENEIIKFIDDAKTPSGTNKDLKGADKKKHDNKISSKATNQKISNGSLPQGIGIADTGRASSKLSNGTVSHGMGSPKISNSNVQVHGSPSRSQLNLNLNKTTTPSKSHKSDICQSSSNYQCPMCSYVKDSPTKLEEHVNRQHFDLTSPSQKNILANDNHKLNSSSSQSSTPYPCPLCTREFQATSDLEFHVNIEHKDILSPKCTPQSPGSETGCPICGLTLAPNLLVKHVDEHFSPENGGEGERSGGGGNATGNGFQRMLEEEEFLALRAQYGMDNQGNYNAQSAENMRRAVYSGEMSVSDFYERQIELREAESYGVDDGMSVTKNLTEKVRRAIQAIGTDSDITLCTYVDHYASSYGDRGWGCGYRNAQMLLSSLLSHTGYNELLYRQIWKNNKPSRAAVASISRLQTLIETAWNQGFDLQGSEQLGCKLYNTRKWIGATEIVTLLSSMRVKCQLVDFHKPSSPDGTHPELFKWVFNYFKNTSRNEFVSPLYLQHQGHSRTIMGVEQKRDGTIQLLVLDPSHSSQQMDQFSSTNTISNAMRLIRKGNSSMKARQYQLVAVIGTIDSDTLYEQSKILRGIRIPQD